MIIVICGLPGTGKTTLAKSLAPLIDASILSTDKIRKELFPKPTYSKEERELVYNVMLLIAKYSHKTKNCILDATFNLEKSRLQVKQKLNLLEKDFVIIECHCPEEIIFSRLANRKNDLSDANITIYQKMKKIYEPVKLRHINIDTTKNSDENARIIVSKIKAHL